MMGFAALYPSYVDLSSGREFAFSRRFAPELCFTFDPLEIRGRRESRVLVAPVGPVQQKARG